MPNANGPEQPSAHDRLVTRPDGAPLPTKLDPAGAHAHGEPADPKPGPGNQHSPGNPDDDDDESIDLSRVV